MRKNSTLSVLRNLLGLCFILFFSHCDSNKACEDVVCGVNQQCFQGNCLCFDGYEGASCQDLAYEKYVGFSYNVSESCQNGPGHNVFFGDINSAGSPLNKLIFPNFLNSGQNAEAFIGTDANNMGNYLRFNSQNLGGSAWNIVGEGYYEVIGGLERIRIEIQSTENGQAKFCTLFYQ